MNNRGRRDAIRAEQLRALCENTPQVAYLHPLAASVLVVAFWSKAPAGWLLGWGLAVLALSALRHWHARRSAGDPGTPSLTSRRLLQLSVLGATSGALWGLGYLMFAMTLPVEYLSMIVVVLAGVGAGGLIASYGVRMHFYGFLLAVLGPPAVYGVVHGGSFHGWISLLMGTFALCLLYAFSRYARAVAEFMDVRLRVGELEASKRDLEAANCELAALSWTDGLTQIANRRHFDNELQREWARAKRTGGLLSYLMVDIDYFKPFNDRYGHLAGDECLKQVAQAIQASLRRPGDFLGRYGGEEFAILSPDTPAEGARVLAEKIRDSIEALAIPHEGSDIAPRVTVSIGVATLRPAGASHPEQLIVAADRALYQAKAEGRNRVGVMPPATHVPPEPALSASGSSR